MEEQRHGWLRNNVGDTERMVSGVGGGALAAYGLVRAITNRSWGGAALGLLGGFLAYRGLTGHCPVYERIGVDTAEDPERRIMRLLDGEGITVRQTTTINRGAGEIYTFWRNFENLPRFMEHLESVRTIDGDRSGWVAKAPLGLTVEWDAEITADEPEKLIAWQSLEGADIDHIGYVRFTPARQGGTEVDVELRYRAPLGKIGATLAKLLGEEPSVQVKEDLRRFKQLMETNEIPTIAGQSSGRGREKSRHDKEPVSRFAWGTRDVVDEASWESFPASDPPAW